MQTSLIITTYNWPEALDCCFRSIARQSVLPDEIVVADDGSGPETQACIDRWRSQFDLELKHVWQEHKGFRAARSRNLALAETRHEYVITLDGDMIAHRHLIADHLAAERKNRFVQGVRLLTRPGAAERIFREGKLDFGFFDSEITRRRHTIRLPMLSRLIAYGRRGQRAIRGCNQGYWRDDLLRVNGWDERMIGWGLEDNEIAERLYHAGVLRIGLRFAGLATHIYHPKRVPEGTNPNAAYLQATIQSDVIRCPYGVDQYLAGNRPNSGNSGPA